MLSILWCGGCQTNRHFYQSETALQSLWPRMDLEQPTIYQRHSSRKHSIISSNFVQWVYSWKSSSLLELFTGSLYYWHNILSPPNTVPWTSCSICMAWQPTSIFVGNLKTGLFYYSWWRWNPGHSAKFGSYGIFDLNTKFHKCRYWTSHLSNSIELFVSRVMKTSPASTWRKWGWCGVGEGYEVSLW